MTSFRLAAYAVCIEDGRVLLARHLPPNGEPNRTLPGGRFEHAEDPVGTVIREVADLRPSSPADTGIALAQTLPATGHTPPIPVGGLVQH
ncbi:NUDIX domain-containing protein [Streptomyces sp. NPDC059985]|uniref:NUDIX domain-containing protein n=1 Tax=Streptomyces sp. NPDC059985 TaxID=3347025 RepID=UPI0036926580